MMLPSPCSLSKQFVSSALPVFLCRHTPNARPTRPASPPQVGPADAPRLLPGRKGEPSAPQSRGASQRRSGSSRATRCYNSTTVTTFKSALPKKKY